MSVHVLVGLLELDPYTINSSLHSPKTSLSVSMYTYHAYYSLLKLNSDNVMGNGYNKLINGINTKSF